MIRLLRSSMTAPCVGRHVHRVRPEPRISAVAYSVLSAKTHNNSMMIAKSLAVALSRAREIAVTFTASGTCRGPGPLKGSVGARASSRNSKINSCSRGCARRNR
jgi:hypothetical protein